MGTGLMRAVWVMLSSGYFNDNPIMETNYV